MIYENESYILSITDKIPITGIKMENAQLGM